jgi:oligo-1,6-glucosidase
VGADGQSALEGDWWRSAVVYQIYPRSFADSNDDGIGDIRGIIDHLDHISDLGVDAVWLSPVYPSPQADNGYDISEYCDIDPVFGTLADFDDLTASLHARGIRLVMDMVVNHTSDEHPWFLDSASSDTADHADWYIWRDPRPGFTPGQAGSEPNNWGSFFGGSAWEWVPARGQYYLHLFDRKQPDLNWQNPAVRSAIHDMMRWWLERGVDGFRLDVINFISKPTDFVDAPLNADGWGEALPTVAYGALVHEYLAEMKREVFDTSAKPILTVGEMPGVTAEQALRFTHGQTGQLNMVFQFDHVDLDQDPDRWRTKPVSVLDIKRSLSRWQESLGLDGWNSLYWCNHDQPRPTSRFGDPVRFWYESATALALVLHLHRGTPYIYQGEEIGMVNMSATSISAFRDIEAINYFRRATTQLGVDRATALRQLNEKSRDNARTPMQWTAGDGAGFSHQRPWIEVNASSEQINVAAQSADEPSILAFYKKLIQLRHDHQVVVEGSFNALLEDDPSIYAFERRLGEESLVIVTNLTSDSVEPALPLSGLLQVLSNYSDFTPGTLRPWEAMVLRRA